MPAVNFNARLHVSPIRTEPEGNEGAATQILDHMRLFAQETKDGRLVVLHDAALHRGFPPTGPNIPAIQLLQEQGIAYDTATIQVLARWSPMFLVCSQPAFDSKNHTLNGHFLSGKFVQHLECGSAILTQACGHAMSPTATPSLSSHHPRVQDACESPQHAVQPQLSESEASFHSRKWGCCSLPSRARVPLRCSSQHFLRP